MTEQVAARRFWTRLIRDTVRDHGWPVAVACGLLLPLVLLGLLSPTKHRDWEARER